jgi:hypothetical protein
MTTSLEIFDGIDQFSLLMQIREKTAWGKIYGSSKCGEPSSTSSSSVASNFGPHASEMSMYIDSDPITMFDDDFDLLSWWHEHETTYPILSILAKNVLTVPVSTISSESAFSLTGKIIEERRRSLGSSMVEVLTYLKDWQQGEDRQQHTTENVALEEAYKNQYLDEDGAGAPVDQDSGSRLSD